MRKKDKLYTVNKWNRPLFMPENTYDTGGLFDGIFGRNSKAAEADKAANPWDYADDIDTKWQYKQHQKGNFKVDENSPIGNGFGGGKGSGNAAWVQAIPGALNGWTTALANKEYSSDAHNGFSLVDTTLAGGNRSKVGMGLVNSGASFMNKGLESGNGAMALVGGIAGTVGTIINGLWGTRVDEEGLKRANASIAANRNFRSNAGSFDDITGPASRTNTNVYSGGVFSSADDDNAALAKQMNDAYLWADRSVLNNIYNLSHDQIANFERNYSAFGGPIEMINDNDNMGAIGYGFMSDYLSTKKKQADSKNQMTNLFAGTPSSMFAIGGDLQTASRNYSVGKIYDVTEEEANRLKSLGYELIVVG